MSISKKVKIKTEVEVKEKLIEILNKYQKEIINFGTDWVYKQSVDLKEKRPREETLVLVTKLILAYKKAIIFNNYQPLNEFIKYVAEFRGKMHFRISTPLKGFLSLKKGVEPILAKEIKTNHDRIIYLEIIRLIDNFYEETIFKLADYYQEVTERELKKSELELQSKLEEEEKFNKVVVGRELKMVQLKEEVEKLKKKIKKLESK